MRYRDLISKNQILALTAKIIEGAKLIVFNLIVARYFGPETFGIVAYAISIISIISIIAEFRLQGILVKEYSTNKNNGLILGSSLAVSILFSLIGVVLVGLTAITMGDESVKIVLIIYSLTYIYKIPRVYRALFIAGEKNIILANCELIVTSLTFIMLYIALISNSNIEILVFIYTIGYLLLSLGFIWVHSLNENKCKLSFSKDASISLIKKSAPLVLSGAAMIVFQRVDIIFIKHILDSSHAGIYAAATNIVLLFSLVPIVISESLAPKYFKNNVEKSNGNMERKYFSIIISVGIVMTAVLILLGGAMIDVIYGQEFKESKSSLMILSASPILMAFGSVAGQLIIKNNTQNWAYIKTFMALLLTLFCNYIFIPLYGIEGAAIATIFGLCVANIFSHILIPVYRSIFLYQIRSLIDVFTYLVKFIQKL